MPRRPGGMISAHINRFNRGDIDLNDNIDESTNSTTTSSSSPPTSTTTTTTIKATSEITSL